MFKLKPISKEAIPSAIDRAKRYRLLNQPWHAESICRDVMSTEPDNQQNLIILVLAITDQFTSEKRSKGINDVLPIIEQLKDLYQKEYASGIVYERQAWAALNRGGPRAGYIAYYHLLDAMEYYERSQKSHPDKNEESVLRWNTCARMISEYNLKAAPEGEGIELLE
jgi:hypothetical protein